MSKYDLKPAEDLFEIEAIRGHIWKNKRPLYEVKWAGYDESQNTWEPEDNLIEGYF